jgi:hypothetical protein
MNGRRFAAGANAGRANARIVQALTHKRLRVPLSDIADNDLRQCVVLGVTKCGRFLVAYQQFEYLSADFASATWYMFSMWRINGHERATRALWVPLFGTSQRAPFVDVASMQITVTIAADQSFVAVHGQPPNPPGSASTKRCHVTVVPTPFAVFDRARFVSERSLRVSVLHLSYLVAPPYPGVVPQASLCRANDSGATLLLHCGAVVRQVTFCIRIAPTGCDEPIHSDELVGGASELRCFESAPPVDAADCFNYPQPPSELLRDFECDGFAATSGEDVEMWLNQSIGAGADSVTNRQSAMHAYVRLEDASLAFNIESALMSMRQRLPRLTEWSLADYDARTLLVEDGELLVMCCALFRPRRRVGSRECVLVALLGADEERCRVVQLLELANRDEPMPPFALNHKALRLSVEWRAKLTVPRNPFCAMSSMCNASVFRGTSLSHVSAAAVPLAVTI